VRASWAVVPGCTETFGLVLYKEDEEMVKEHLAKLQYYTNGYHFSNTKSVPKVFNTDTVMWYLEVMFLKQLVLKVEPSAD